MEVFLKDISKVSAGNSAPKKDEFSNEGIPFVRAGSLAFLTENESIEKCEKISESIALKKKLKLFNKGSILFAKSGMSSKMGRIYQLEKDAFVVSHLAIIEVNEAFANPSYIKYFFILKPPFFLIRDDAYPSIKLEDIKNITLNLPDLPTQNKIVALLDKASELVNKRENSIGLLDELLRAQFLDMFGDPVMANKHDSVELKFYLQKIQIGPFGSQLHRKDYIKGGIPLVNPVNIIDNKIFPDNSITLTEEKYNSLPNYHLNEGDIIMARRGEMGRCGLITEAENNWFCGTGSLYLRPKNIEHSVFLLLALTEFNTIEYLNRNAKGVTMKNLNKTIISNIPIIKCEDKLILKFNSIYQNIQSQKETLIQSKTELENLYNSLLQRAFSGQLNFNVDAELDVLLAAIDVDKEENDIRDIATVYASRLLERLNSQDFENQTQYQQAKQVAFQMLKEGAIEQEYDTKDSSVKMKLV